MSDKPTIPSRICRVIIEMGAGSDWLGSCRVETFGHDSHRLIVRYGDGARIFLQDRDLEGTPSAAAAIMGDLIGWLWRSWLERGREGMMTSRDGRRAIIISQPGMARVNVSIRGDNDLDCIVAACEWELGIGGSKR